MSVFVGHTPDLDEKDELEFSFDKFMDKIVETKISEPKSLIVEDESPARKLNRLYGSKQIRKAR